MFCKLLLLFLLSTFPQWTHSTINYEVYLSKCVNFDNNNYYHFMSTNNIGEHEGKITKNNKNIRNRNEDTLYLDDGNIWGTEWGPYYYASKFTPGVECTLKAVILKTYVDSKTCSLFIWPDSSGYPKASENLISPIFFTSLGQSTWQRVNLQSLLVTSDDFWLAIHTDGSPVNLLDGRRNYSWNRFAFSWSKYTWFFLEPENGVGERVFRVIGNFSGTRHDVSCYKVYSPNGFLLPNPSIVKIVAHIINFSNTTEKNFPVRCDVIDSLHNVVFSYTFIVDSLRHGEIDSVSFDWTATENGDYVVRVEALLSTDCILDNDTAVTETHIVTYPAEFHYDDGEEAINAFDSSFVKFTPPYYPCKIESIRLFISAFGESLSYFWTVGGIYDDGGAGGMPGSVLCKDSILGLIEGYNWYTIDFHASSIVIDTGSFYAGFFHFIPPSFYVYLRSDWNPPYTEMSFWCYESNWYRYHYNDEVMIRAFVDYPSAVSEEERKFVLSYYLSLSPTISNGKFKCSFCSSKDERIEISLYGIDGRRIRNLFTDYVKKGLHYFYPDISDLPEGVYFIQMKVENLKETKKVILLK